MRLKSLIYLCLFIALASPAQARITLGMISGANSMPRSEALAGQFASYLENRLGEPVKVRLFSDETVLHQWLTRYREIDVAFLSEDYFRQQRNGEFFHLADPLPSEGLGPVVSRQGAKPRLNQSLRDVLLVMDADPAADGLLKKMGIRGFTLPGKMPRAAGKNDRRQGSLRPAMQILSHHKRCRGKGESHSSDRRTRDLIS